MEINFSMAVTAADVNARTISGRVVTWGETGFTSAGKTVFASNSLAFKDSTKLLLEHDRTRPIGKLVSYDVTSEGIDATFKVANTMAGEDALVEASDGLRDGFSVGVSVDAYKNEKGTMKITAATVQEISLVTDPAIASARVEKVSASSEEVAEVIADEESSEPQTTEGEQVSDTTVPEVAPAAETVEAAKSEVTVSAAAPVAYTRPRSPIVSAGSYVEHTIKAAMGDRDSALYVAAANDTSTNDGLTLPSHLQEFVSTSIGGRPAVDSITTAALPASGLSFTYPVVSQSPTWDAPVAELDAPVVDEMESSYATVDIKKAFTSQKISWELLDRSAPNFYSELLAELVKSYARKTDALTVAAFINNGDAATEQTADADGLQKFIAVESAAAYKNSGSFARNLLVNATHWSNIMQYQDSAKRPLYVASNPMNNPGAASSTSLMGSILGQNLMVDPHIASGDGNNTMFLIAPDAATFYEGARAQLQVQNLGDGSLTIGLYNYYAVAVKKAAGIRRFLKDA